MSRTETQMGREWRERLDANRVRQATLAPDPDVPGLLWPNWRQVARLVGRRQRVPGESAA